MTWRDDYHDDAPRVQRVRRSRPSTERGVYTEVANIAPPVTPEVSNIRPAPAEVRNTRPADVPYVRNVPDSVTVTRPVSASVTPAYKPAPAEWRCPDNGSTTRCLTCHREAPHSVSFLLAPHMRVPMCERHRCYLTRQEANS